MSSFRIIETPIGGLTCVDRGVRRDDRGFFGRFFCQQEFQAFGWTGPVAQINHTMTLRRGALRGLHFQYPPHGEIKFVSCLKGEIFDVAVDLRKGSRTFLQWHGERLSADNRRSLLIPEGFAHGFQCLSDDCELVYLHSRPYAPDGEGGLNARDPTLAIAWPLPVAELSERDAGLPFVDQDFAGLKL